MKKYKIKIEGVTPYMQHRMDDQKLEEWEKNRKLIIERDDIAKEDAVRAEFHAYIDKGKFYMPAEHIEGALINAGKLIKAKVGNSRKSMANIVAGMFSVFPEKLPLPKEYVIDKRSAVNRNIKARVICIRPKWENWKQEFELLVDNDTITIETIKEIVKNAGDYIGIGSYTPRQNGKFGRFKLVNIQEI